jgi:hypothetical protein
MTYLFYNDERANTEQRRILYLINRFLSIASERSIKWLEISAKYSIYLCFFAVMNPFQDSPQGCIRFKNVAVL